MPRARWLPVVLVAWLIAACSTDSGTAPGATPPGGSGGGAVAGASGAGTPATSAGSSPGGAGSSPGGAGNVAGSAGGAAGGAGVGAAGSGQAGQSAAGTGNAGAAGTPTILPPFGPAPTDKPDTLVYMLAYKDRAARDVAWKAFQSDPDWVKARAASEVNGSLTTKVENLFMSATDYSPVK